MDFNVLIKRVINILIKPMDEWVTIKNEQATVTGLITKYALIVGAIPAVCGLLGFLIAGAPFSYALSWLIFYYILMIGGVIGTAFIIDGLAPSFDAKKDLVGSFKVAVYSYTASWVAGFFFLFLRIRFLVFVLALYGVFLLYLGIQKIKEAPKDKELAYFIICALGYIIVNFLAAWLAIRIAFGRFATVF
jgi:hypothetical protein